MGNRKHPGDNSEARLFFHWFVNDDDGTISSLAKDYKISQRHLRKMIKYHYNYLKYLIKKYENRY